MKSLRDEYILIIDFGSQYTKLIARRCRELHVFSRIIPYDKLGSWHNQNPKGIILSGGPGHIQQKEFPYLDTVSCPVLGICLGMHIIVEYFGGIVAHTHKQEYGKTDLHIKKSHLLFPPDQTLLSVWMSHGDSIKKLPPQFDLLATTTNNVPAAICNKKGNYFALQFHPEVTHTESGTQILQNFIFKICSCSAQWNISSISKTLVSELQHTIGTDNVLLGISGGVDSAVSALLLQKAIGKQLHCMFIDTGLLRKHEASSIIAQLSALNVQIYHINAQKAFLKPLRNIIDPNKKRKIIGKIFIRTFKKESKKWHHHITWLAQGTIYSDVIESAGNHSAAHIIKPHHNVGALPSKLRFRLIEPIRDLFKDEVRTLGIELGLPPFIIHQHPFPGPGLAIRIIGKITPLYLRILREADTIFIEELKREKLYRTVDQAFAVFLPLKSVGVTGDQRRYTYTIALRAVQTKDYMTAQWAPLTHTFLQTVSRRITNDIPEVTRVVYDISNKPPATIEWE